MKKRPVGRPKIEECDRKKDGIRLRLTTEDHTRLAVMAQNRGVSMSNLLRILIEKEWFKSGF